MLSPWGEPRSTRARPVTCARGEGDGPGTAGRRGGRTRMPQPLDAGGATAGLPSTRPRPTPTPRGSTEELRDDADVWGMVRRAQDGDAEAFGELYDHYVTLVHRYAYHRVATGRRPRTSPARRSCGRCAGSTRCPSRAATWVRGWSPSRGTSSAT